MKNIFVPEFEGYLTCKVAAESTITPIKQYIL